MTPACAQCLREAQARLSAQRCAWRLADLVASIDFEQAEDRELRDHLLRHARAEIGWTPTRRGSDGNGCT